MRAVRYNEVSRKVISVPHTGTRFLFTLLNCHHKHIYEPRSVIAKEVMNHVIVVPLRHPDKVWRSWVNGIEPTRAKAGDSMMRLENFENCWMRLGELDRDYDIHYIPIDSEARETEISKLSGILQEDIRPDWNDNPWHHQPTAENLAWQRAAEYPDVNWRAIYQLPMISRFY